MNTHVLKIPDLLADFASKDITVWVDGDRLRCNAPAGALTPEFRDQLRDRKGEIIGFLNMAAATVRQQPAIVPLQPHGTQAPIYAVPGHIGAVISFSDFSKHLGEDQPFFALEPPGLDGRTEPMDRVEDIAEYFADQILEFQPRGPYVIAGYCSGAATAYELARLLDQRGADVRCAALFGPLHPSTYQTLPRLLFFYARRQAGAVVMHLRQLAKLPSLEARVRYVTDRLRKRREEAGSLLAKGHNRGEPVKDDPVLERRARLKDTAITALRRYIPAPYRGRVCIFLPNKAWVRSGAAPHRWLRAAPHAEFYYGPKDCYGPHMLQEPDAPAIAELYRSSTRRAAGGI
ncbi:thioesterase domain-containing protein [Microvirga sp. M2]|uniref:thioesterase domain-containing protein n=1 Tax=Microvirga sp. M2 TaxID=3073270 RepID=UPI0039C42D0A